jgi:hypothetical protein
MLSEIRPRKTGISCFLSYVEFREKRYENKMEILEKRKVIGGKERGSKTG